MHSYWLKTSFALAATYCFSGRCISLFKWVFMESVYYCEQEDIPHQIAPYHYAVSGRVLDSR